MGSTTWVIVLVAMCAVTMAFTVEDAPRDPLSKAPGPIAFVSDEDSSENDLDLAVGMLRSVNWVACDFTGFPRRSCQDCNTKLICFSIGGLLGPCKHPNRPYCNNGICSATPSAECSAPAPTPAPEE